MLLPMLRENNSALTDVQKKKIIEENSDGFPLTYKKSLNYLLLAICVKVWLKISRKLALHILFSMRIEY